MTSRWCRYSKRRTIWDE